MPNHFFWFVKIKQLSEATLTGLANVIYDNDIRTQIYSYKKFKYLDLLV